MASKLKYELSIVIPCYNEEKRLPKRFKKVKDFLLKNIKWELIFVNDGSADNTEKILNDISKLSQRISIVSYKKNQGKGYAVSRGVKKADGQIIGFMDADFSYKVESISKFIKGINQGADILIADRSRAKVINAKEPPILRKFAGRLLSHLNNFILDFDNIFDSQCGFKFFKRDVAKDLFPKLTINRWLWDIDLLKLALKRNYKIQKIPVDWEEVGNSKVNILKDLLPVGIDLVKIYLKFFSIKMFLLIESLLTFILLAPFLIDPKKLVLRSGDYSDFVWPNFLFFKESVFKDNQFPLWNPTIFSGIPEIANPASVTIYPPNYLSLMLPIEYAILVLIFCHVIIAGLFLYLLAKRILGWSAIASCILSFGVIFSPFLWTKFSVGHLVLGYSMLIFTISLYFGFSIYKNFKWWKLLFLSLSLSLIYLNHPTIWYYSILFGGLVIGYICLVEKKFKKIVNYFLAIPISLFLITPIFFNQLRIGSLISRSELTLTDLSLPLWSIKRFLSSVFIPSNFLNDLETETWLYPSLMLVIFALLGFIKLKLKFKILAVILVTLVLVITLGNRTVLFNILVNLLPGFSYLRVTTRDWFVLIFVLSFLAAWFIQQYKGKLRLIACSLIFLDLIIFSVFRLWFVPDIMQVSKGEELNKLLILTDGRYYCTNRCLSASWTQPKGVETTDGYHILVFINYNQKLSEAGGFNPSNYTGNIPGLSAYGAQPSAEKLGKFSTKWIISKYLLTDKDFKLTLKSGEYYLYENQRYLPKYRFQGNKGNKIEVIKETANFVELKTKGSEGNLIFATNYTPGWRVYVNGKEQSLGSEDNWAMSVYTPSGENQIVFKYQPFF